VFAPFVLAVPLIVADGAPAPVAEDPPPVSRGWVGVGGRNVVALASPATPEFGVDAFAGLWLLHEHLQPILLAGWSAGTSGGLIVDTFRVGGEVAAGMAFAGEHFWIGGAAGVAGESLWTHRGAASDIAPAFVVTDGVGPTSTARLGSKLSSWAGPP
jgi:hypothetical protein